MYDVTDTVFRQMVGLCAPPDMYMTEFVNVDGLQSAGRQRLLHFLKLEKTDVPVVAQIWGKDPENYYKTAQDLVSMGFSGIDINTGCPDKTITKNGCCAAYIKPENRQHFAQILEATKKGAGDLPVSVKTRLGWNETDFSWHEFLLRQDLSMLTVHGRTKKEMSKVPARWEEIAHIARLRDEISPDTKIIGNGDVETVAQAKELMSTHGLDGVMIGRGIFKDPYLFSGAPEIWESKSPSQKIDLYIAHLELYKSTYSEGERRFDPVKKFMKVYISGFDGASAIRDQVARTHSVDEAVKVLASHK